MTYTPSATIQRAQIIAKLRRDLRGNLKQYDGIGGYIEEHLLPWIKTAPSRHNARRGGLRTRVRRVNQ